MKRLNNNYLKMGIALFILLFTMLLSSAFAESRTKITKIEIAETITKPYASSWGEANPIPELNLTVAKVNDDENLKDAVTVVRAKWMRYVLGQYYEEATGNFEYQREYSLVIDFAITDDNLYYTDYSVQVIVNGLDNLEINGVANCTQSSFVETSGDMSNVDFQYEVQHNCTVDEGMVLVVINPNGGAFSTGDEKNISVSMNGSVDMSSLPSVYKDGYIVDGWLENSPLDTQRFLYEISNISNITYLYANWVQEIDVPTVEENILTYNGEYQSPVVSGYDKDEMDIKDYSITSACDANYPNYYSIYYVPKDGYAWKLPDEPYDSLYTARHGTKALEYSISSKTVSKPTLSQTSFEYTGEEITPKLSFASGEEGAFMISGQTSATSVGDYTMTISLSNTNNYTFGDDSTSYDINWSIVPMEIESVVITGIMAPTEGKTPSTVANVSEDYHVVVRSGPDWYKETNTGMSSMSMDDKFELGKSYRLKIRLEPMENCEFISNFETGTKFILDGVTPSYVDVENPSDTIWTVVFDFNSVEPKIMRKVTTDYNGGTYIPSDPNWPEEQNLEDGEIITFNADVIATLLQNVQAPEGYEFDCFEIDETRYELNSTYTITSDITLKLLWKRIPVSVKIPSMSGDGIYVFNNSEITASLSDFNDNLCEIVEGTIKATEAGEYIVKIGLKHTEDTWEDGTTEPVTLKWKIVLKGDLNYDLKITILDVRLLLQEYINSNTETVWSARDIAIMDMDENEKINIVDVRLLLQSYINS